MKLQNQPLQVATRALQRATARLDSNRPPWMLALVAFPPTNSLVRPARRRPNPRQKKFRSLYKPPVIEYEEDGMREQFFGDHPWELARPRSLLEPSGPTFRPGRLSDYSKGVVVRGRQTNGESVIQRWLYLTKRTSLTRQEAYDVARREFYDFRHAEDVGRIVAAEEAQHVGAVFGPGPLEIGGRIEDVAFGRLATEAIAEAERKKQRTQATAGMSGATEALLGGIGEDADGNQSVKGQGSDVTDLELEIEKATATVDINSAGRPAVGGSSSAGSTGQAGNPVGRTGPLRSMTKHYPPV